MTQTNTDLQIKCKCGHPRGDHYPDVANNLFCIIQFCFCKNFQPKEADENKAQENI